MFEALLNGRIPTQGLAFEVGFQDIEELNEGVSSPDGPDISKISYAVLPAVVDRYALLDSGSALGRGNGQLLVRRRGDRPRVERRAVHVPVADVDLQAACGFRLLALAGRVALAHDQMEAARAGVPHFGWGGERHGGDRLGASDRFPADPGVDPRLSRGGEIRQRVEHPGRRLRT